MRDKKDMTPVYNFFQFPTGEMHYKGLKSRLTEHPGDLLYVDYDKNYSINDWIMQIMLAARPGVDLFIPYLPYSRQDRPTSPEPRYKSSSSSSSSSYDEPSSPSSSSYGDSGSSSWDSGSSSSSYGDSGSSSWDSGSSDSSSSFGDGGGSW